MEKPNYFGILPANVRYDKRLKPMEKILYAEITALSNKEGYCYATNRYFGELYEVHKNTVGIWINHLEEMGYLKTVIIYKENSKEIVERRLYITTPPINENVDTYQSKDLDPINEIIDTPINENVEDNNTSINNKINNIIYLYKGEEYKEKFDYFIEQRKFERKSENKDLGSMEIELYQKRLFELSKGNEEKALKILEKAIMRNWRDFYMEEKGEKNGDSEYKRNYTKKSGDAKKRKPDYSTGF